MQRQLLIAAALLVGSLLFANPAEAQFLNVNVPISGVFTPFLPIDGSGKPFTDYQFVVNQPGTYQIDLRSTNTSAFDPYLVVLAGGVRVAANDDGGGGLNSRVVQFLQPGRYTVRVTRFGTGPIQLPVTFTISVTMVAAPPPPPPPQPRPIVSPSPLPGIPLLTDAIARVLITDYYHRRSEWAGQYRMSVNQLRVVPVNTNMVHVHARYNYSCVQHRCSGASRGVDQRVFYLRRQGTSWRVVRMGGHMSARF